MPVHMFIITQVCGHCKSVVIGRLCVGALIGTHECHSGGCGIQELKRILKRTGDQLICGRAMKNGQSTIGNSRVQRGGKGPSLVVGNCCSRLLSKRHSASGHNDFF